MLTLAFSHQLASSIMNFGGRAVRGGQLFGEQTTMAMTKKYFKGLQGVENIYTQHKPYLIDLLQVGIVNCSNIPNPELQV